MSYLTYAQLAVRYPDAKNWATSTIDVSSVFIYEAEAEINARLAPAYTLPISGEYPLLTALTADQAAVSAMMRADPKRAGQIQDWIDKRIERLVSGTMSLVDISGGILAADSTGAPIWSTTEDYAPAASILDADSQYTHIDSNYIADEEDAR